MRVEGAIYPTGDGGGFSRAAWCELVAARSELRRPAPQQVCNPFTGGTMAVQPPADAAQVVLDGREVGEASWPMSDEPLVVVSVEPAALGLVAGWAAALGGEFRADG